MNVHIEYGPEFKRQFKRLAKKYHSLKTDYGAWLDEIYKNPLVGDDGNYYFIDTIIFKSDMNGLDTYKKYSPNYSKKE